MPKSSATTNDLDAEIVQKVLCKIYEADVPSLRDLPLWRAAAMSAMKATSATAQ